MAKQKRRRPRPGGPGRQQLKPQWQPIEALAMIAAHIDGMLQVDREQYEMLLEAKPKPHVLDDYTINRVIAAFTTQRHDFGFFDEQLQRWAALPLSDQQRREVERLVEQMRLLRENNERVLTLARELSKGTIDKVMATSDVELGLRCSYRAGRRDRSAWVPLCPAQEVSAFRVAFRSDHTQTPR